MPPAGVSPIKISKELPPHIPMKGRDRDTYAQLTKACIQHSNLASMVSPKKTLGYSIPAAFALFSSSCTMVSPSL
ncbi:hypothetical protein FNV43_RR02629 [Rhamnella rubrinervis]|uniref:Uncharacterized protein n=1 Tax=Rhamnella rubrinervis TaxID=2594499 RepID=A0A8K0HRS7_9ROSA|nr:hypothetical protein FNV43_RR02629 [Rhamnella rubrinervis]